MSEHACPSPHATAMAASTRPRRGDAAPPPLAACSEADIVRSWSGDLPLVTVVCRSYQHGGFIQDALRGFLGQRTTFPFEVLIRDDASTDGTAEIVEDHAVGFPNVIRAVLEPRNRWRDPARPSLRAQARGTFIATCEGDDYWTDPRKLDLQVAALLGNPDAVLAFHQVVHVADGRVIDPALVRRSEQCDLSAYDLMLAPSVPTPTLMHRNLPLAGAEVKERIPYGDRFLTARMGEHGEGLWIAGIQPSVYRAHAGGVCQGADEATRFLNSAVTRHWIGVYFQPHEPSIAAIHQSEALRRLSIAQAAIGRPIGPLIRSCPDQIRELLSDCPPERVASRLDLLGRAQPWPTRLSLVIQRFMVPLRHAATSGGRLMADVFIGSTAANWPYRMVAGFRKARRKLIARRVERASPES